MDLIFSLYKQKEKGNLDFHIVLAIVSQPSSSSQ